MQKTFYSNQKITFAILFSLICWRIIDGFIVLLTANARPTWDSLAYLCLSYGLISLVLWINRRELRSLNIDKFFIKLYPWVGLIITLFYLPPILWIFTGTVTFLNFQLLRSGEFSFENTSIHKWQVIMLITLSLLPELTIYIFTGIKIPLPGSLSALFNIVLQANLPELVFEEILFRGMLWMFLKSFKINDGFTVLIQAILFWLAHIYYLSKPVEFWILVPSASIFLGIIVWRSKSISASIIGHFLHNLLVAAALAN